LEEASESESDDSPAVAMDLPPLSSDGLLHTSPIKGTKEQRTAKAREKGQRKRRETLANKKASAIESSEENKVAVFEEVLESLQSNGLSFGDLMLYVFDPIYKKGIVRWEGFFKQEGLATKILNLWVSSHNSRTAREEVGVWAESYVEGVIREEATNVTESKVLQTGDTSIDNVYVTSFSMTKMGSYFQDVARVSMRMLAALATSSRNLKASLQLRAEKRFTVCIQFNYRVQRNSVFFLN
jgi:hypothetical protein